MANAMLTRGKLFFRRASHKECSTHPVLEPGADRVCRRTPRGRLIAIARRFNGVCSDRSRELLFLD
jgi:hypothetical protein